MQTILKNHKNMQEKAPSVGALWRKTSKSGTTYYSGNIQVGPEERMKVVAFINNKKTNENQPDIIIYPQTDKK